MNVYQKLAKARLTLKQKGLKQTGKNKYVGYDYFELGDFVPQITEIEESLGLLSVPTFSADTATLRVFNAENPEEMIEFTSPMSSAEMKGCHPVQSLGAVETYQRRYLYNMAYDIVECDALNATQGANENEKAVNDGNKTNDMRNSDSEPKQEKKQEQEEISCCICGKPCNNKKLSAWIKNKYPNLGRFACGKECWDEMIKRVTVYEDGSVEWKD